MRGWFRRDASRGSTSSNCNNSSPPLHIGFARIRPAVQGTTDSPFPSKEKQLEEVWGKLRAAAAAVQQECEVSAYVSAGGVCAERNALFSMITQGDSRFTKVLCLMTDGRTGAPCGACRELMAQLMPEDYKTVEIMLDFEQDRVVTLGELTSDGGL